MISKKIKSLILGKNKHKTSEILQKDGLIFIHIPKNAGTSIYKALGFEKSTHSKASEILQNNENKKLWDSHFSFAVVRHPINRFISLYNYARMEISDYHNNVNQEASLYGIHFDYHLLRNKTMDECVDLLLDNKLTHDAHSNHWFPQYTWVYYRKKLAINKIYKLEELHVLKTDLAEKFDIFIDFQMLNTSNASSQQINELSLLSKQKLYQYYRQDFELFNYDLE